MITVNVLYANTDGSKFNMNYYLNSHIPMIQKALGAALKGVLVQQGVGGGMPGSKADFQVITQLKFDSVESFQTAFGPHAPEVMADLQNFTNVEPHVQISEVMHG